MAAEDPVAVLIQSPLDHTLKSNVSTSDSLMNPRRNLPGAQGDT
jgi:hypothetical protein